MARNETTRIKDVGAESGEHGLVGNAECEAVFDTPRIDHPGKAERIEVARTDKVNVNTLSSHIQVNILKNPLLSNFEQQLRDIDVAISREASDIVTEPGKEVSLDRKELSLNLNKAKLEMKEGLYVHGPNSEAQLQMLAFGPQEPRMKFEHQLGASLGLSPPGNNFKMGLSSPKQQKVHKMKKNNGAGQKKNKENRDYNEKNTNSGKERMQVQGENRGVEIMMEVDHTVVGGKKEATDTTA